MIGWHKDKDLERAYKSERFLKDYQSMIELREKNSFINFTSNCRYKYPSIYILELNVTSITDLDKNYEPILSDIFRFKISYSNNFPYRPIFKVHKSSNDIFHPHITYKNAHPFLSFLQRGNCRWIDERKFDPEENLADMVIRLAKSLQYHTEYINENAQNIANLKALSWFLSIKQNTPQKLPIARLDILNLQDDLQPEPQHFVTVQQAEQSKKKFDITNRTIGFRPTQSPKPVVKIINPLSSIQSNYDPNKVIYILPKARQQIFSHISWNNQTEHNRYEQGGILLGNVYTDGEKNITYGVVEDIIIAEYTTSNPIHLNMTHETWDIMLKKADNLVKNRTNLFVIGWYHTHPNNLDVFMSNTDVETQKLLFSNDWNFAIVLNPHSKIWRAFYGANAKECQGFFIEALPSSKSLETNNI